MAEILSIAPSNLLVDPENPRLSQPNEGQREAQRSLAKQQQRKVLALAKDIVECGLNPADLSIVMGADDKDHRYFVLEGNRRLVALRALENPDSFVGAFENSILLEMRKLAAKYQRSPIDQMPCLVVRNRDDAEHWIRLRHTGENQSAGIVPWGGDEANRFRARGGAKDLSTQALIRAKGLHYTAHDKYEGREAMFFSDDLQLPKTSQLLAPTMKLLRHKSRLRLQ